LDAHTLSPQGKELLDLKVVQNTKSKQLMAKWFCLPQTGQILLYIHQGELQLADVVDDTEGFTLFCVTALALKYFNSAVS